MLYKALVLSSVERVFYPSTVLEKAALFLDKRPVFFHNKEFGVLRKPVVCGEGLIMAYDGHIPAGFRFDQVSFKIGGHYRYSTLPEECPTVFKVIVQDITDVLEVSLVTQKSKGSKILHGCTGVKFGDRLRMLRGSLGFTQEALSCASGINRSTIASIEAQHFDNPRLETVRALASGLGILPSVFLD